VALTDLPRIRIAAIRFLNPAPLMWDFEHPPFSDDLASRYQIDWMLPSECADRLASGAADIGLVPIATLAVIPGLRVLPGCTIASKDYVRSLLLVRRADQPFDRIRTVAADTASRTTVACARMLFNNWGNPAAKFLPMAADLDVMLAHADAAIVIGDPALMALEEQANRFERTGEDLVYHDLAHEWHLLTGLPFVSAVWAASPSLDPTRLDAVAADLIRSRDHGLASIDPLAREWSRKLPLSEDAIRLYLSENIHYVLDEACLAGIRTFFESAAQAGILPPYRFDSVPQLPHEHPASG
jgi:chorismate dehydratase